jgi:hypothetical protein
MQSCDYRKSDMTPCVLVDGPVCFAFGSNDEPICVGCERSYRVLGVPRPADWDQQVEQVRRERARTRVRRPR